MKKGTKLAWALVLAIALMVPAAGICAQRRTVRRPPAKHRVVKHRSVKRRGRAARAARWKPIVTFVNFDEPVREFPSKDKSPVWDFWKNVFLARDRLEGGDAPGALDLLRDLPAPPSDIINKNQSFYRRLYRKALETGLEAAKRASEPDEGWRRRLWAYFPDRENDAPESPEAMDGLTRLHLLYQRNLFDSIPGMISISEIAAAEVPDKDKCRAFFELGWALQKDGEREDAVESYGRVAEGSCEARLVARSLFWKGSLESDLRRYEAAEATFSRLTTQSAGNRYADDAYYRLSQIYEAQDERDRAERALRDLLKLPEGDMKEKYLWDDAFSAIQGEDYERAEENLEKIIATRPLGTEAQPQALYWKGRIAEIRSKKKLGGASAGLYRQVLKSYPFSFYALLAEARLGSSESAPSLAKARASLPPDRSLADALRVVDDLNRRMDHEAAADALDYLTYVRRDAAAQSPEAIAERWAESGDYNRALELAAETLDKSVFDIDLARDTTLTRALYPVAYERDARREAEGNRLPLALVLGIMREESLFIRGVRSHAGAVGVMQLMPATARIKAKALGLPPSAGDLKDPPYNIKLGTSFLRDLMDRFDGQTALAVMGYNAGPGNVNRWLGAQGFLPLDEFIEAIPLTETRGYVKRVLRSAYIYGHLLGHFKRSKLVPSLDPPNPS
ncbi:MAG TPA: transglycosylase SLT domain-containing protein [bacterium]|nr:transglycosylase SLT domain-containing protein [bacterium]